MTNLPAVRTEGTSLTGDLTQLVSFHLDNEEYGVEVLKVREIIRMIPITNMPNSPQYVEGIINLRGKIIPIVSLRKKFGLMEQDRHTDPAPDWPASGFRHLPDGLFEIHRHTLSGR
jgi:purine-binding chemotaxis protein CheW